MNTISILSLSLTILAISGCSDPGPPLHEVRGTVTLNNAPLVEASLEFNPETGAPSYGTTDENGRYVLRFDRHREGAEAGRHKVRITMEGDAKVRLPLRYNEATELTKVVSPGENQIDFELTTRR